MSCPPVSTSQPKVLYFKAVSERNNFLNEKKRKLIKYLSIGPKYQYPICILLTELLQPVTSSGTLPLMLNGGDISKTLYSEDESENSSLSYKSSGLKAVNGYSDAYTTSSGRQKLPGWIWSFDQLQHQPRMQAIISVAHE